MAEIPIKCPSGLEGRVRGLKGREFHLLSSRREARSGEAFQKILAACWLETTELGPYKPPSGVLDWTHVVQADRMYTLIQIRNATYPEESYCFWVNCANPNCGERFEWELNLDELPVKDLPESSRTILSNGGGFTHKLPDGKKLEFKLITGADEKRAAKLGSAPDLLDVLGLRIISIEGVDRSKKIKYLEEMEAAQHRDLLDAFDDADGGIETEIEVECTVCGNVFPIELPFDASFFLPRKRRRKGAAAREKTPAE